MQPVSLGSLLTPNTMVWHRQCAVGYSLQSCQALAMCCWLLSAVVSGIGSVLLATLYCWLLTAVMTGIGSVLLAVQYSHVGHWQCTVGYSVLSCCIGSVLLATKCCHVALAVHCWLLSTVVSGTDSVLLATQYCHVWHWQYTVG